MACFLYNLTDKGAYVLQVSGIKKDKLNERQEFHVENGAWSAYYQDGVVTYPRGDWRHGTSREMELYLDFTFTDDSDLNKFDHGYYNYVIYRFEKDVIGLHKEK